MKADTVMRTFERERRSVFLGLLLMLLVACNKTEEMPDTIQQKNEAEALEEIVVNATPGPMEILKEQTGFYVEGSVLYDANNNPFVMRGVNHMHTWYPEQLDITLAALERTGCNAVRIVLSNGEQWDRSGAGELERIIELCKKHHLIAVLEVHDTTGSYQADSLLAAAQYFVDVKDVLIGEEEYVIINVANEWPVTADFTLWKKGYEQVLPILREAGMAHTIMVDCAGGGQYGACVEEAGAEVLEADPLGNVMFSIHVYGTAGGSEQMIEQNLDYAAGQGLCICVGEFGYKHSDGDVDEAFLMQYCEENRIGYLAWAWKGNAPEAAYLDIALQWDGVFSEDWGETVINASNGIAETAKRCTVFECTE